MASLLAARDTETTAIWRATRDALAMTVEVLRGVELQASLDMRPHSVVTEAMYNGRLALEAADRLLKEAGR